MRNGTLLILNGPGLADSDALASDTVKVNSLEQIRSACERLCADLDVDLDFRQTDDQDRMIDWIRNEANGFDALVINPMGCAKTSPVDYPRYVQDLDVLASLSIPVTEIHLTNVLRFDADTFSMLRGPLNKTAFVSGLGLDSYLLAIRAASRQISGGAR